MRIGKPLSPPSRSAGVIGNFAEIGNVEPLRRPESAAAGKNFVLLVTTVANEITHVLDDADDRNHDFVEHASWRE